MEAFLVTTIFGVIISVIGIINMTGNLATLHWYHRKRVAEADKKPMGKLVGLGTIIIGLSMIIFGILFLLFDRTKMDVYVWVGSGILIAGLVVGIILNIYAIIKYNKGLF